MRAPLRYAVLASAALIYVSGSGCARREADDPRRAVVDTYAQIVLATYEDSLNAVHALDAAVDALLASPSEAALNLARQRWKDARIPYGHSETFRFYAGPIDGEGGLEGQMNGWPLDENHIDAVRLDQYNAAPGADIVGNAATFPEITPELIAAQNEAGGEKNIASGYHAIEFLLWGQDLNDPPESAGKRAFEDFVVNGDPATDVNARRGKYLKSATTLLIRDLESVAARGVRRRTQVRRPTAAGCHRRRLHGPQAHDHRHSHACGSRDGERAPERAAPRGRPGRRAILLQRYHRE